MAAHKTWKPWNHSDEDMLRHLWLRCSQDEIAKRMGRTRCAISRHATKIKLPPQKLRKWLPSQRRYLREETATLINRIALRTGRTPSAAYHQLIRELIVSATLFKKKASAIGLVM